jgi:hypothetical protein
MSIEVLCSFVFTTLIPKIHNYGSRRFFVLNGGHEQVEFIESTFLVQTFSETNV